ncbi:MAG: exopolysaccharide biosynthesis polyprenyl glycosylphosphotransferase, partial [Negativicutes bacterium]|nr:exopolysaccharide biosynthesis polyprenyl glycosylphosphotransferase [Negativicutes bacterium]
MANEKAYTSVCADNISGYNSLGLRARAVALSLVLVVTDYIAILAAVWTAYLVRELVVPQFSSSVPTDFDVSRLYMYMIIPFPFLLFMHFDKLYTRRLLFWQQMEKLFKVSVYAMIFVVVFLYLTGYAREMSRIFMVLVWVFCFASLVVSRYVFKNILTITGLWQIPVVLIGAGKTAELLINAFKNDSGLGYKVVGLVEDNPLMGKLKDYPVLGTFDRAEEVVKLTGVKDVLIAAPGLTREGLLNLVYRLQPYVKNIAFVPDLFGVPLGDMQMDTLFNERAVLLRVRNNLASAYNRFLKISFDVVGGVFGLIVGLPLMVVISLLIYVDNPGPVIFAHRRVGRNGKEFPCYKFRSMIVNAEATLTQYLAENQDARAEWQRDFKLKNDPRITRIGAFLRKTSLDELPQFFNVVKGEMSMVGPRPIVAAEVEKYGEYIY